MVSQTPRSSDLASQPVTVEAANSKHLHKDVPLHPELVTLLRQWLTGLQPGEKLFPILGRRRTWLMVKKDLERVGIAYENEDGIADFYAAAGTPSPSCCETAPRCPRRRSSPVIQTSR